MQIFVCVGTPHAKFYQIKDACLVVHTSWGMLICNGRCMLILAWKPIYCALKVKFVSYSQCIFFLWRTPVIHLVPPCLQIARHYFELTNVYSSTWWICLFKITAMNYEGKKITFHETRFYNWDSFKFLMSISDTWIFIWTPVI